MRILISGARGYIGSKLVAHLRAAGHVVTAITREAAAPEAPWLRDVAQFSWDMRQPFSGAAPESHDLMIHAAGANDVDSADPREALLGTTLTARHVLAFCRQANIRRLIYFSTFQVFGRSEGDVSDESPVHCTNDYALTHWFAEEYLRTAQGNGQIECIVLRPTNVYGAPLDASIDRWTLVPACFCKEAARTHAVVLRSSGRQYRNFIHVDQIADAVNFLAQNFSGAAGRSYILAGPEETTIRALAEETVARYTKKFGKACTLVVESAVPVVAAPLRVHATRLSDLGYHAPAMSSLGEEIDRIFELISST